ncbi:urate hydroxylase PuuD [Ideonella sp. 4Y11]|uniref:Urate hydroxylase PuuD n=1 Tax=Ideonella aquatica TaxID=2824119 RepID=A0A941BM11_9BURK|nr:urate hydroxylase PuuD [Ideonella aquatica]MBQ0961528.1 urate hydroxylase PuuD [Ideonella aquatica]
MEAYLLDWANLLLRWLHVITAIAWVGSSFYFVWLDNHLIRPKSPDLLEKGVDGALWAVHGGGFYNPQKYMVAPKKIHTELHWFFWESYSTWLSGFALFTVLYLFNASTFLIDQSVYAWTPLGAIAAALGFLVVFWLVYDGICRTLGAGPEADTKVGVLVTVLVVFAAWLACQLFAGRAAFLLVGAMMATAMSANVFFWIIPGQRKIVAAMTAGQPSDPIHGKRGKQRSVHNTYFTLPVLAAMLSNHYGMLYSHRWNWVILVLIMLGGALIRHFFVARHKTHVKGLPDPWAWAVAGIVPLLLAIGLAAPWDRLNAPPPRADAPAPTLAAVQTIVQQRCVMCHNEQVNNKGVMLHSAELITRHAPQVYQQVVVQRLMPLNNATGITEDERALIGRWFDAGARP